MPRSCIVVEDNIVAILRMTLARFICHPAFLLPKKKKKKKKKQTNKTKKRGFPFPLVLCLMRKLPFDLQRL